MHANYDDDGRILFEKDQTTSHKNYHKSNYINMLSVVRKARIQMTE